MATASASNKHSCLLAVLCIAGLVLQLAFFHKWNTDTDKKCRHGDRTTNEPVNAS